MKSNKNDLNNKDNDIDKYQKQGFFGRIPFGVKATFIKYWFYGAVYFFCFMGLGLIINSSENLVLATGLIGGALFDVALYNIYILIADSREEASKWWFFKTKKFYSIFVNVTVLIGLFFAFVYLVRAIKSNIPNDLKQEGMFLYWLFQEPLSSALLLVILDTALVWSKNGLIILFKKIFYRNHKKGIKEDYIKIVDLTPISVSIELNNKDIYFANKPFNVLINNEVAFKKVNTNTMTIYDLKPDTQYNLTINQKKAVFTTPKIYKFYKVYEGNDIQRTIDQADQYSLIVVNPGTYKIKNLVLKNNIVLYLRKGATLLASNKEDDYPIISPYNYNKTEAYGNYLGEAKEMRQSIIHMDHLSNVVIVGEGTIDAQAQQCTNWKNNKFKVAPPHLIFINHCKNVSIIGLTLKNSPQWSVHPFFSHDINLINLNINNTKESILTDGIAPQCSSSVRIIGCNFSYLNNCISLKSGRKDIMNAYHTPTKEITISNCLMENSKSAICFGDENSSGISSVNITRSYFKNSDSGILMKTRRGNGKEAVIKDINIDYIKMENVLTPFVMNMFSSYDVKDNIDRILSKKFIPIDNDTPYFNNFTLSNIEARDYEYACGYFYGLPEKYIYEIKISDSVFSAKPECKEGIPISLSEKDKCYKNGFIAKNIRSLILNNVKLEYYIGKRANLENVSEFIDKQ